MKNYEINSQTLAILSVGNNKSEIIEKDKNILLNQLSTKIIDNSCKFFGSSYNGRFDGTKSMAGISHKAPIIIEESRKIIFFPTSSPRLSTCNWISLNNIDNYYQDGADTIIVFSCGKQIKLPISYGIIDNQILRASRLESILDRRIKKNA